MSTTLPDILPSPLNPTGTGGRADSLKRKAQEQITCVDGIEWLSRLVANPDFKKYQAFVATGLAAMEEKATDIDGRSQKKRDAWAQRTAGVRALYTWPGKQLAALKATHQKIEAELRDLSTDGPAPTFST